jgi:cytidine deaminase
MNHDHPLLGELVAAALSARNQAYAPYSKFLVSAALLSEDVRIFTGCNVENASYGLTICAERNAVFVAVAAGCRTFTHIVIATDTPQPTPPCGACRQVLFEFSPNLIIGLATPAGLQSRYTLGELLPRAFGPKSLG